MANHSGLAPSRGTTDARPRSLRPLTLATENVACPWRASAIGIDALGVVIANGSVIQRQLWRGGGRAVVVLMGTLDRDIAERA